MVNMTLSVPRQALLKRAKDLELLDKLTSKSTLRLEDVMEIDSIIKEGILKSHRKNLI